MLTPDDIVNYPLKRELRGYDVAQVDDLLDQLAEQVDRQAQDIEAVREQLAAARVRVDKVEETESTLRRTLVTAQRAAEQSIAEARTAAEEIVERARAEADGLVAEAQREAEGVRRRAAEEASRTEEATRRRLADLERSVDILRSFATDHRARLRAHLERELAALDALQEHEPPRIDRALAPSPTEPAAPAGVEAADALDRLADPSVWTERSPRGADPAASPTTSGDDRA